MKLLSICTLLAGLMAAGTSTAADKVDLGPEQAGRIRAARDTDALAALPRDFKFVRDGVFTVAITPNSPPVATYATDAKTVVGADADFAQLMADALGLKLELQPIAWADWPLGLSSGKYDAVISNVGVTEQRKEKFDFSTYRQGLHGFYVKTDSAVTAIKGPPDIAGLRLITSSGTIQERILLEWNRRNLAAGLKPVELQYYDDDAARTLALLAGRADAAFNPNAPQAYLSARDGKTRLVGTVNAGWPLKADVAVTTRKGSGLAQALTRATNRLIANGKYAQALARWGLQPEALARSETNPPGLPKF
jgi:polar amino acid transport system substrate-binding protein